MAVKPKSAPPGEEPPDSAHFHLESLAHLPVLIWTTDRQFCFTSLVGGGLERDIQTGRFLHKPVDTLFQAECATKVRDAHFLAGRGEHCRFEFELGGRDYQAQVTPMRDEKHEIKGVVGIALDQTDRLVAQRALKLSEQNYRLLIEEAPHAICRCTPSGSLLQVNRAMQEMLGYSESDLLMLSLPDEVFANQEEYSNFLKQVQTQASVHVFEAQWLAADRQLLHVSLGGRAVRDSAGELLYVDLFAENITERRQLEEQLRHAQKMQAVGQLAGGIAHDFNNLLTVIRGQAEMMSEEMLSSDPLSSRLEELERAADRATSLTRQLLAFSRRQVLQPKVIDLNTTVSNMNQMLVRLIGENIELVFHPAPDLWRIRIDPGQIEQVLMNLAVNARDAMPQGGRLTLRTWNVAPGSMHGRVSGNSAVNYVVLSVTDTGHGMDESTKARIFEPFFTTKEVGKGTGLGLSVVYGVIKQSGGHVSVQSQPGVGTTFDVYLPATEAVAEDSVKMAHGKMSGGTETILLAEDDEAIRHMLVMFLRNHGYHVLVANNGQEAETLASQQRVDLLLSDMLMPKLNGCDLAMRLMAAHAKLKVILMSGNSEDPHTCPQGIVFLQKPFSMHALSELLRQVLGVKMQATSAGRV